MLLVLLLPLTLAGLAYAVLLLWQSIAQRALPRIEAVVLGFATNFFDTLGIGSFAPTMAYFKLRRMVPDRIIPQTMLVGHTLPSVAQALIFLVLLGVKVDPVLLVGSAIALLVGAMIGVGFVSRTKVWVVQAIVGFGLILAAIFYGLANLGLMPLGGTANSLPLDLTMLAIAASFGFGILMNFGVGNYAPTLALLSLMGLDPRLCFPIMAGGAGLAGTAASTRHILSGKIDLKVALGLALGGIPAVLIAAFLVQSMPVEFLRWLIAIVVLYTAVVMLRSAFGQDAT
jgi:uncharacterized membrane protein YfcA